MFSMCSELTPRAPIPDGRMERIMQPCPKHYLRLQAAVQCVQQQEYYRMVGFLTASWRTREELQQ